jgi:hypothetical protein
MIPTVASELWWPNRLRKYGSMSGRELFSVDVMVDRMYILVKKDRGKR